MKPTRVALLAALGMFFTSVSVYSLTPPGGFAPGRPAGERPGAAPRSSPTARAAARPP